MPITISKSRVQVPVLRPENLDWISAATTSLTRSISPPPTTKKQKRDNGDAFNTKFHSALVESGEVEIDNHVDFFSSTLQTFTIPALQGCPRLEHSSWVGLYTKSINDDGHHFVIHQHDHPVAGTHYDLRLQCNATSSISFAIMYGLPGNPNSRRPNRNATETRVHNLWNHLIETASHETGTMLLWDTGEYDVLPYYECKASEIATDEDESSDREGSAFYTANSAFAGSRTTEQSKLHLAFQQRKIRLRLNGTRLPRGYTISLRLTNDNFRAEQPKAPSTRRRKFSSPDRGNQSRVAYQTDPSSESDDAQKRPTPASKSPSSRTERYNLSSLHRVASPPPTISGDIELPKLERESKPPANEVGIVRRYYSRQSIPTYDPPTLATVSSSSSSSYSSEMNLLKKRKVTVTDEDTEKEAKRLKPSNSWQNRSVKTSDNEESIQLSNAYPGATNDIGSVYQRRWYLSLDKKNSGFIRRHQKDGSATLRASTWIPRSSLAPSDDRVERVRPSQYDATPQGFEPFFVRGRDHERSIITGRLARDILADEGVEGYVPRGLWRAVLE